MSQYCSQGMCCVNSIATLEPISFKLYGDKNYHLYNYSKDDTLPVLIQKYKLNHNLSYKELGKIVNCSQGHLWMIEHENKNYSKSDKLIKKILQLIKKDFTLYIIVGNIIKYISYKQ